MASIRRFNTLEVATGDLADALTVWQRNFGFPAHKSSDGRSVALRIGDAEIRLVSAPSAGAEGMSAIHLEADDVEKVAAAIAKAGYQPGAIRSEGGRRVLAIDPALCNQVPLFVFDRKA
jgi:hypothetical protein